MHVWSNSHNLSSNWTKFSLQRECIERQKPLHCVCSVWYSPHYNIKLDVRFFLCFANWIDKLDVFESELSKWFQFRFLGIRICLLFYLLFFTVFNFFSDLVASFDFSCMVSWCSIPVTRITFCFEFWFWFSRSVYTRWNVTLMILMLSCVLYPFWLWFTSC